MSKDLKRIEDKIDILTEEIFKVSKILTHAKDEMERKEKEKNQFKKMSYKNRIATFMMGNHSLGINMSTKDQIIKNVVGGTTQLTLAFNELADEGHIYYDEFSNICYREKVN